MPINQLITEPRRLRQALNNAFPVFECKKALAISKGNFEHAAEWLTDGRWRESKLVEWDVTNLNSALVMLKNEFVTTPYSDLRKTLLDCAGDLELTKRKLLKLPIIQDRK